MTSMVCVDGEMVPGDKAKVSVWDHGFLYGDGLFETMRAYEGRIFALEDHLQRLRRGSQLITLSVPWTDAELTGLLHQTIEANNLMRAYVRLTQSRGPGPIGLDPSLCPKGTLVIMAKEVAQTDFSKGISLGVCPVLRNHPLALPPAVKSMNFMNNILAKIWSKQQGYAEALMLSQEGWITETTVSNIFFIKDKAVFTPSESVGILGGVTRKYVIKAVNSLGMPLYTGHYSLEELRTADEIFLTNSGSEVIPVSFLDQQRVGPGLPGYVTREIHAGFNRLVQKYLDQAPTIISN